MRRRPSWRTFITGLLAGLVLCVPVTLGLRAVLPPIGIFGVDRTTTTREGIESVLPRRQVVLLRLGIQGVSERQENGTILGRSIPGSDRAAFLQYSFGASLGVEGTKVGVDRSGEHAYRVRVPGFVFIGHDDVTFKLAAQQDGVLSFVTPKIDTLDMVNAVLDDGAKAEYVRKNDEILREQARDYYRDLITAVDPGATVEVTFG